MTTPTYVDSHCHLESKDFDKDRDTVINEARSAGVGAILVPGTDIKTSQQAIQISKLHKAIFTAVGIHPHEARKVSRDYLKNLKELFPEDIVVAVGEIGLDYYYDFSPREIQRKVFREQINLALEYSLPLIIHTRESMEECFDILDETDGWKAGGVFHCFPGSLKDAEYVIKKGMYISFTGIVTFKNASRTREMIKELPLERLLLETDAPYMAPVPKRGKRNEPAFLVYTAKKIAEIKGISEEELSAVTTENFTRLFGLEKTLFNLR